MHTLNLFDSNFPHQACSVATQTPRLMRYVRNQMDWPGVTVFTDGQMYSPIVDDVQSRYKIGWLHEARSLHSENYDGDRLLSIAHKFDAIMTHDANLLAWPRMYTPAGPGGVHETQFLKTIRGGSWVSLDQWGMYPKSKDVAMILSEKTQLEGHKLRHTIADARLPIDVFGPQPFYGADKGAVYKDYRFAVVVEACREDNFFSEHLIDALAYGCVPLYWGCPNIAKYFPHPGIIQFDDVQHLTWLVGRAKMFGEPIVPNRYEHLIESVSANQQAARAYAITEDWQIEHCLAPFLVQP